MVVVLILGVPLLGQLFLGAYPFGYFKDEVQPNPVHISCLEFIVTFETLLLLICQPNLTLDVAPSFVLGANRSMDGILHNN
jgi:hypothetical protein